MKKTVAAIAREGQSYTGVLVREAGDHYELLLNRQANTDQSNWRSFYQELSRSWEQDGHQKMPAEGPVVGYDSGGVAFYRFQTPAVNETELEAIVRMRAEALLPLPIDEMAVTWRGDRPHDGKIQVTLAAARNSRLESYLQSVTAIKPSQIYLIGEAVVQTWRKLYGGVDENAVIAYLGPESTQLCLCRGDRLAHAINLDVGLDDLSGESDQAGRCLEALAHDVRGALEHFGCAAEPNIPVYLLSNDGEPIRQTVAYLNQTGMNAIEVLPQRERLTCQGKLSASQLYDMAPALGLALMGQDPDGKALDVFEQLYVPPQKVKKQLRLPSIKVALPVAILLLVTWVLVAYRVDVATLNRYESQLQMSESGVTISELIREQTLRSAVKDQRIDILDLLDRVTVADVEGVLIDSVIFKRGQMASLTGHSKQENGPDKYLEALQATEGISETKMELVFDAEKKQTTFTITFHYKDVTQKKKSRMGLTSNTNSVSSFN